jgi:hypothetical protein
LFFSCKFPKEKNERKQKQEKKRNFQLKNTKVLEKPKQTSIQQSTCMWAVGYGVNHSQTALNGK